MRSFQYVFANEALADNCAQNLPEIGAMQKYYQIWTFLLVFIIFCNWVSFLLDIHYE